MANKILIKIRMLEMGIIPARSGADLVKMMNSIPEEERRFYKRKFRKAWRKLAKKDKDLKESLGLGCKKPSREQKIQRAVRVYIDASKEK
jgi:DNA invertase Pin-like site-specific DNA recombinase